MSDAPEWLIRKDGYFYRPNCQGYTTHKHEAGRYSEAKARAEAAVEPWHMKAIHESEWPDDHVSAVYKDNASRIATLEAEVSRLTALVDEAKTPTHRHKKRGSEYVLIGVGKMQAENWRVRDAHYDKDRDIIWETVGGPVDMRVVAIYRSVDDGALWVRPREEFEDGRFEEIAAEKAGA